MITKNLDQNLLADTFRRFPAEANPTRGDDRNDRGQCRGREEEGEEGAEEEAPSGLDANDFSNNNNNNDKEEKEDKDGKEGGDGNALD